MDLLSDIKNKRTSIQIIGILALIGALFAPSMTVLWEKWILWDQDLAHALPTLGVFIFFIWRITPTPYKDDSKPIFWLMIFGISITSITWYLLQTLNIQLPAYLCLIALIALFIAGSFSFYTALQIMPVIGILFFVVPLWSEANTFLVDLSAYIVGNWVAATHLTALIEGNSILIPSGTIYIAGGCSGLRYLTISLLMGYIIVLLNRYTLRQAVITLLIAVLLGLLANWIRIFSLVLIGYHTEMQSSLMRDHETFGWILFAAIMMPAIYFAPMKHQNEPSKLKVSKFKPLVPAIFLALGPLLLFTTPQNEPNKNPLNLHAFENNLLTEAKPNLEIIINLPSHLNIERKYILLNNIPIKLELYTYTPSISGGKIVPYIGTFVNASDWITQDSIQPTNSDFGITIFKQVGGLKKVALLHQFNIGENRTDSYFKAKLFQIKAKLQRQAYFGMLTIQTSCEDDCLNEQAALSEIATKWRELKK